MMLIILMSSADAEANADADGGNRGYHGDVIWHCQFLGLTLQVGRLVGPACSSF